MAEPKGLALLVAEASKKSKGESADDPGEMDEGQSELGASLARDFLAAVKSQDEGALSRVFTNLLRAAKS